MNNQPLLVQLIDANGQVVDFESVEPFREKFSDVSRTFEYPKPENFPKISYQIDPGFPFSLRFVNRTLDSMRVSFQTRTIGHYFDLAPKSSQEFFEVKDSSKRSIPIWKCFDDERKITIFADILPEPSFFMNDSKNVSSDLIPEKYGAIVEIN